MEYNDEENARLRAIQKKIYRLFVDEELHPREAVSLLLDITCQIMIDHEKPEEPLHEAIGRIFAASRAERAVEEEKGGIN